MLETPLTLVEKEEGNRSRQERGRVLFYEENKKGLRCSGKENASVDCTHFCKNVRHVSYICLYVYKGLWM